MNVGFENNGIETRAVLRSIVLLVDGVKEFFSAFLDHFVRFSCELCHEIGSLLVTGANNAATNALTNAFRDFGCVGLVDTAELFHHLLLFSLTLLNFFLEIFGNLVLENVLNSLGGEILIPLGRFREELRDEAVVFLIVLDSFLSNFDLLADRGKKSASCFLHMVQLLTGHELLTVLKVCSFDEKEATRSTVLPFLVLEDLRS
jgi:hypothetical protein